MKYYFIILFFFIITSCSTSLQKKEVDKKTVPNKPIKKEIVLEGPSTKGNGSFIDKTNEYGLGNVAATQFYVVDFDNDGFEDLVTIPNFFSIPVFYRFNPYKAKLEKLEESPIPTLLRASFLAFADFNGDHIKDMILGVFNQKTSMAKQPLKFYVGSLTNGKYSLRLQPSAFPSTSLAPNSSLTILDYNLDGFLDIYVGHWFDVSKRKPVIVPDAMYQSSVSNKNVTFKDVSFILKDELLYEKRVGYYMSVPTMGVTSCDIDLDGFTDILTSSTAGYPNKLWKNVMFPGGGRAYMDVGARALYAQDTDGARLPKQGGNSLFSMCFDYNNDGVVDVVTGELSHSYDPEYRDRSSVLTGSSISPVKFIRSEYYRDDGSINWNQADRRGVAFDYNSDGLLDFSVDNSGFPPNSRLILFEQAQDHGYQDVAKKLGVDVLNPSGTVAIDFNQDGRVDLLTGHSNIRRASISKRVFLFENQVKTKSRRLRLFVGSSKKMNSQAIGATIRIHTNTRIQTRTIGTFSGGQSSQNMEGALWGFSVDERIEKITVLWPYKDKNERPIIKNYDGSSFTFNDNYGEFTLCFEKGILSGLKACL